MLALFRKPLRAQKITALTLSLSLSLSTAAAVTPPGGSRDSSPMNMGAVQSEAEASPFSSNTNLHDPSIQEETLEEVLRDSDRRLQPQFRVPPGMENSTAFWLKIYSVYSSQQVVVYDADHPENIYEVLDFRPLAKTARSPVVYEILFERRVKKALERYRAAFKHLAKLEKQKKKLRAANQEEKNILRAVQQLPHRHSVADLSRSLRAQTGQRDHVIRGILAADPFMKRMETLFDQMGVPRELTRLSLVESSFNYKAISYAGAAGVWQFMPKSGKEFLMIRPDRGIDERISPLKSTVAAAKLLKRNYKFLGSWALAISAYNHGHSKLVKIPDAEKKFSRIGRIYAACERDRKDYRLGYASRNYYPEFLAMLHADAYKDLLYGEKPTTSPRSIVFHRVTRSRPALELVVKHGFSIHDFQLYNPDVRNLNKPLPKGFWYAVPGPSEDLAGLLPRSARRGGVTRTGI